MVTDAACVEAIGREWGVGTPGVHIVPLGALMPEITMRCIWQCTAWSRLQGFVGLRANFGRQIPENRLARVILRYGTPVNPAAGGIICVRPSSWGERRHEIPRPVERTVIVNPSMWARALRIIPRLDKDEWDRLDVISKWLIATRAAVLIMTFISAAIAGILVFGDGQFNFGLWLLATVGLVMAHATNNLLNDLTDYRKGVDKDNYFRTQYGAQPIQQGLWTEKQLLTYAAVTGLIAPACGIALTVLRGPAVLALLAAGAFFGAVLHLAVEVYRPGRTGGDHRVGATDDRGRLLRHHRPVELARGACQPALRPGADHGDLRQAHRQA